MFGFVQRRYEKDAMLNMHYYINYVKIVLHRKGVGRICAKN